MARLLIALWCLLVPAWAQQARSVEQLICPVPTSHPSISMAANCETPCDIWLDISWAGKDSGIDGLPAMEYCSPTCTPVAPFSPMSITNPLAPGLHRYKANAEFIGAAVIKAELPVLKSGESGTQSCYKVRLEY